MISLEECIERLKQIEKKNLDSDSRFMALVLKTLLLEKLE